MILFPVQSENIIFNHYSVTKKEVEEYTKCTNNE